MEARLRHEAQEGNGTCSPALSESRSGKRDREGRSELAHYERPAKNQAAVLDARGGGFSARASRRMRSASVGSGGHAM